MTSSSRRYNEIKGTGIVKLQGCEGLAKELNIPIIALMSLSRQVENRDESKKPQLSDLGEVDSIEQDARVW